MGYQYYSLSSRGLRTETYASMDMDDLFTQNKKRQIHHDLDPNGLKLRECRDSANHPESYPIIVTLDVTGSMGDIPFHLIKTGLPTLVSHILTEKKVDPAVLFMAQGDYDYDSAPLQVGQFESGDLELDECLRKVYVEGNGGDSDETYFLGWYVAAFHTVTDAWEKRKQKGILITIGDAKTKTKISADKLRKLFGPGQYEDSTAEELLKIVREKWEVFHIDLNNVSHWEQLMEKDHYIRVAKYSDVPEVIAKIVNQFAPKRIKNSDPGDEQPEEDEEEIGKTGVDLENIPDIL